MDNVAPFKFDEVGYWSEIKLDIVKDYAAAYSKILAAQKGLYHIYIDAFAGSGVHFSRTSGELIPGSPLNALSITPPFREYHFIDLDKTKVAQLRDLTNDRKDIYVYEGDCNRILLDQVFPKVHYKDYRRGLCLLDPYGLHLEWEVIEVAGQMESIELFLNFPVADINRNVLWRNPAGVSASEIRRMDRFWGDRSWREVAYSSQGNLFGFPEKEGNEAIAMAFRDRLTKVAGFGHVPEPIPMRNKNRAIIYYLFFASQKSVAEGIVAYIFDTYRDRSS